MIGVIAATAVGRGHALHLAGALPGARVIGGRPADAVASVWASATGLVLCMATGAAVRLIAPHLTGKRSDPPVVTVDDAAAFAIALTGGHHGGNELASRVADALGARPVITTASEALGLPALDRLGADLGLTLDPASAAALAPVGAALIGGEPVHRWRSRPWPTGPLPGNVVDTAAPAAPGIAVTDELLDLDALPGPCVVYRPRSLVVGVGASSGVTGAEVGGLIDAALAEGGLSALAVDHLATIDRKAGEPGIVEAAAARGWTVVAHPAERLAGVEVPNPSEVVRAAVGTPSVAEAAALAGGGELLVAKRVSRMATVAVARKPVRGRLALVSTGPGDEGLVPPLARAALATAEVVVGLDQYVERARGWLRPGCKVLASPVGNEVARAEQALAAARAGRSVALLSGGDVGVYGMASPALERAAGARDRDAAGAGVARGAGTGSGAAGGARGSARAVDGAGGGAAGAGGVAGADGDAGAGGAGDAGAGGGAAGAGAADGTGSGPEAGAEVEAEVEVVTVPGVTAAVAAAALLGSPLGHDHCAVSLSDLLTPWEVIRARLRAAAEGDFVVALYNPRSRGRDWQLDEARRLLLASRPGSTPVGVVTDAYRPTQRVVVTTLAELDVTAVGMRTIVIVGNRATRIVAGRMVTPRGYA